MICAGGAAESGPPSPRHSQGMSKKRRQEGRKNKGTGRMTAECLQTGFSWSETRPLRVTPWFDVMSPLLPLPHVAWLGFFLLPFLLLRSPPKTHDEQTDHSCSADKKGGSCEPNWINQVWRTTPVLLSSHSHVKSRGKANMRIYRQGSSRETIQLSLTAKPTASLPLKWNSCDAKNHSKVSADYGSRLRHYYTEEGWVSFC